MAGRLFNIRNLVVIGALAGTAAGIIVFRRRQARKMRILGSFQERLLYLGRRKPSLLDTVKGFSVRSSRQIRKGTQGIAGIASETFSASVLPATMESTRFVRGRAVEIGGKTKEALSRVVSMGASAREQAQKTVFDGGMLGVDIRSSIGKGMSNVRRGAGNAAETAGDFAGSVLGTLVRLVLVGTGIAAVLIYIYAPEREQQARLWEGAKESSRQLGRTFQDLREYVSDMRSEAS